MIAQRYVRLVRSGLLARLNISRDKGEGMIEAAPHVSQILDLKYGPRPAWGWGPILRDRFGYISPDDWYEATLFNLVTAGTSWLDVGCGRDIFPSNRRAAELLAQRCRLLVGIDPSENINENVFLHERANCLLENYRTEQQFDLVTLRMVAEHITTPETTAASLARLTRKGGHAVIYTVNKWSPAPLLAAITPLSVHVLIKRFLWGTREEDSFPTAYKLNTRADLSRYLSTAGFAEVSFAYIDDCRSFAQQRSLAPLELILWRMLRLLGLPYPERCIIAIYRRV